ncbi:TetR/AcrR family transcriptional regulator [Evansella clarkii]|uniref:TetR/AcrR family transcriptional regulator n=1 Tax=Evansella clarkii TaxID=79879 RepID=UPI001432044D|nr:TetR/AcrR family transcriptional regulator [Evansella clarkii]
MKIRKAVLLPMTVQNEHLEESKRGRPLDLSRNEVILSAVLELLAENGYDALTIEAVAAEAKVGKATIYRRWPSKTELVIDAVSMMSPFGALEENLNTNEGLRDQLVEMLSFIFKCGDKKYQDILTAVYSAASTNEQLDKELKNDFYHRHRKAVESIVTPFIKENYELQAHELDLLADIGPALITYRSMLGGKPFERAEAEHIVDLLMMPVLQKMLDENE